MTLAVKIENLTKDYHLSGEVVHALRGVSLDVPEGDYVAIMGPSGSGKSTLLNLLGCLDRPTSGSYFLGGDDVARMRDDELSEVRAGRIGFVFQSFHLLSSLTALENVLLPLELSSAAKPKDRAREALARVGLERRLHHYPRQLSGGEKQRVAIARAFVVGPSLLFADEPTGNLDNKTGAKILSLLFELNAAAGTTLVLVTHDLEAAARCTRLIELAGGRLVANKA